MRVVFSIQRSFFDPTCLFLRIPRALAFFSLLVCSWERQRGGAGRADGGGKFRGVRSFDLKLKSPLFALILLS